jgi:hypothetical protein
MRQGPLWIVEPLLSTGERMSVNDPMRPFAFLDSSRSEVRKRALEMITTDEVNRTGR